jgi:hypothetical protein
VSTNILIPQILLIHILASTRALTLFRKKSAVRWLRVPLLPLLLSTTIAMAALMMSRKACLSLADPLYQSVIPVTLHMNLFRLSIHTLMQIRCPNGFYACNINYIILLRTTLLQVYRATVCYTAISGGYIALQCMKPKLPSPIFRRDNNQTTAATETIKHYGTYLFLLMQMSLGAGYPWYICAEP